jgi:hypothetical protein
VKGHEECHIIVSEFIRDKFPNYNELEGKFFDKVYLFNNAELIRDGDILFRSNQSVSKFLDQNNIELEKYAEIIVGCAHYFFGIYLASNNVKFTFMEDASGLVSRPYILEEIEDRILSSKSSLAKSLGLYDGSNENITKIICNMKAQVPGFSCPNVEDFDLVRELKKLEPTNVKEIINFFGVEDLIPIDENSIMILTQHFANLNIMSYEQQKTIYQLVVDYFTEGYNVVFKPHPNDLLHYDRLFPKSKVVKTRFPSELLPFVFTKQPVKVMTVTSTAINNLRGLYDIMDFSPQYEKNFEAITHRYYIAAKIFSELKLSTTVVEYASDPKLLGNYFDTFEFRGKISTDRRTILSANENERYYFIDDLELNTLKDSHSVNEFLKSISPDALVIFANTNKQFVFYHYPDKTVWENVVPIVIRHKSLATNEIEKSEVIYAFTKNEGIRAMLRSFSTEKTLSASDNKVIVQGMSEHEVKVKVLEGILEATEKRLERYIELVKQLEEKLQGK